MVLELISTVWKRVEKESSLNLFFFIMHGQLLPNLMDQRIAIISFPLSKITFGTLIIQPKSTLVRRALCSSFSHCCCRLSVFTMQGYTYLLVHCETVKINHLLSTYFCSDSPYCYWLQNTFQTFVNFRICYSIAQDTRLTS